MDRPNDRSGSFNIFREARGPEQSVAWALTIYSLVPLLGILFSPFAMIAWVVKVSIDISNRSGTKVRRSLFGSITCLVIFGLQIGLWRLLTLFPELSTR